MGAGQIFSKTATKAGDKALKLLRSTDNLIHYFGEKTGKKIAREWSPCCGLCRRDAYFVDGNGRATTVTYPTFAPNGVEVTNDVEMGQQITAQLGAGFIAYVSSPGNVVILGAEYTKEGDNDCANLDTNSGIELDDSNLYRLTIGVEA